MDGARFVTSGKTSSSIQEQLIECFKKHHKPSFKEIAQEVKNSTTRSPDPRDPKKNDDDDDDRYKNDYSQMTNKEIRVAAKECPINTHGELVFTNGKDWITFDNTGHNGGFWKRITRQGREGTYSIDLKTRIRD